VICIYCKTIPGIKPKHAKCIAVTSGVKTECDCQHRDDAQYVPGVKAPAPEAPALQETPEPQETPELQEIKIVITEFPDAEAINQ
jgi:hypothetical protein